jgi:hypothetical protein
MFLPPEERRPWYPFQPKDGMSRRCEAVLLCLIGIFLVSVLLAPIGGSTILQALLALLRH